MNDLEDSQYIRCVCGLDYEKKDLFCPRCLFLKKDLTKDYGKNNIVSYENQD